ncbi:MAG: ABC transporter ATP-binding protein [Clostridiales Family XIII bacterium]|jgi:multidrug/hemolysin transport system ATP-binding protein|nr:ABC transporter ATP-binding protein [Clostridiales Family XIII bacterium]
MDCAKRGAEKRDGLNIIEIENLKKRYGKTEAVRGIDFYVKQGDLFAFLGPNGAGKSTTIGILCTLLAYDEGQVTIDGKRLGKEDARIRDLIGVVFQDGVLDGLLTVRENLTLRAGLYGKDRAAGRRAMGEIAEATGIAEILDRRYGKLSGGQKRRADIARALVNTPKILFLDEPTTGLDPQSRNNVWNMIDGLKHRLGVTVFMTTHYMEEAAKSDYVTVIDDGRIAARGTPGALKAKYAQDRLLLRVRGEENKRKLSEVLAAHPEIAEIAREDARGVREADGTQESVILCKLPSTLAAVPILRETEAALESFEVVSGTMDDVFMEITGKALRE